MPQLLTRQGVDTLCAPSANPMPAAQRDPGVAPPASSSLRSAAKLLGSGVAVLAGCAIGLLQPPARAAELLQLKLPVLGDTLSARVSELASPQALWAGNSDLAELNRATDGHFASAINDFINHPLPEIQDGDGGFPMVQQMEVLLKQLIELDPGQGAIVDQEPINAALLRLKAKGEKATLLSLLAELPVQKVTIRLDQAVTFLRRLQLQSKDLAGLIARYPRLPPAAPKDLLPGPFPIQTRVVTLPAAAGGEALQVTVVRPLGTPPLAPVVISHGLWDSPTSFLGWAQSLASHGAPVFLPRHPGSDINQQAAMLAGKAPPPDPKEFLRRPGEVRAVLDALDAGTMPGAEAIRAQAVTFIGHSWGGTTALQLAGARSLPTALWQDCKERESPQRNISWVLQCTFLPAATNASLADPRIVRVAAVSPPQGLVFAAGLVDLKVPVLLVSGSRDFVVPSEPEALLPYALYPQGLKQLVVAEGGTHFNLPALATSNGGPLRLLLLRWVQGKVIKSTSALSDPHSLPLRLRPQQGPQR